MIVRIEHALQGRNQDFYGGFLFKFHCQWTFLSKQIISSLIFNCPEVNVRPYYPDLEMQRAAVVSKCAQCYYKPRTFVYGGGFVRTPLATDLH